MTVDLRERYLERNDGDRIMAAWDLARGLMLGDPDTHKAGYTLDNALLAASEVFDLDEIEVGAVRAELEGGELGGA